MSKKKTVTKQSAAGAPTKGKIGSSSPMDVGLLQEIIQLMSANDLNTVDVRDGEKRVILKRGAVAPVVTYTSSAPVPPAPTGPAASAAAPPATKPPAPADDDANLLAIKSPMVGTFYAAPSPDSKAFVSVGQSINDDTEVCVIEAMKNFMPIKAECRGTIARILVTNGQTVEFGQKLFLVKP